MREYTLTRDVINERREIEDFVYNYLKSLTVRFVLDVVVILFLSFMIIKMVIIIVLYEETNLEFTREKFARSSRTSLEVHL